MLDATLDDNRRGSMMLIWMRKDALLSWIWIWIDYGWMNWKWWKWEVFMMCWWIDVAQKDKNKKLLFEVCTKNLTPTTKKKRGKKRKRGVKKFASSCRSDVNDDGGSRHDVTISVLSSTCHTSFPPFLTLIFKYRLLYVSLWEMKTSLLSILSLSNSEPTATPEGRQRTTNTTQTLFHLWPWSQAALGTIAIATPPHTSALHHPAAQ